MRWKPGTIFQADERFIFARKMIDKNTLIICTRDDEYKMYKKIITEKIYSKGKVFINKRIVEINLMADDITRNGSYYKIIKPMFTPFKSEHLAIRLDKNFNKLEEIIDFQLDKMINLKLSIFAPVV